MADPYVGEIRIFGWNWAPEGWFLCDGSTKPIQQYQVLYAVIGNIYGGTPGTSFNLPNLLGCAPMGVGTGPGLSPNVLGVQKGAASVTLAQANLPAHTHQGHVKSTTVTGGYVAVPAANSFVAGLFTQVGSATPTAMKEFATTTDNTTFAPQQVQSVGAGQPHENRQPLLVMQYCIAWEGVFPVRP
jgi:microcystin-dependent protein